MRKQKGITLIALVITIIVLLILSGVALNALTGESGTLKRAQEASEETKEAEAEEEKLLSDMAVVMEEYGDGAWKSTVPPEDKWNGEVEGEEGIIVLPMSLNDCSYTYQLTVENGEDKYEVPMNTYGLTLDGDMYVGLSAFDGTNLYTAELRQIFSYLQGSAITTEDGITPITLMYTSDPTTGEAVLKYDKTVIGGDLKVTNITAYKKQYTGFAKFMYKTFAGEEVTTSDLMECVQFCANATDLGYVYVQELLESNDSDTEIQFNEELEKQHINTILSSRSEDIEAIRETIKDQAVFILQGDPTWVEYAEVMINHPYTMADYFAENTYLNEFHTRRIGNSIIPFELGYLDVILSDLNDDGKITSEHTNFDYSTYIPESGLAGLYYRMWADVYGTLAPAMNNQDSLSDLEYAKAMEVAYFAQSGQDTETSIMWAAIAWWNNIYNVYTDRSMETMYTMMFDNNIQINYAGLRLGYYSLILPERLAYYGLSESYYPYDIRTDTTYVNKQNVSGIMDELYAYIVEALAIEVT